MENEEGHWRECYCGYVEDVQDHVSSGPATEENAEICTVCGYEIAPKLPHVHTGGTATCESQAVCSGCEEPYGEFDSSNHTGGTEVRDAKDATETEVGYTGDTYCLGCNEIIEYGTEIPVVIIPTATPTPTETPSSTVTPTPEVEDTEVATPEIATEDVADEDTTPETGDNGVVVFVMIAFVSLLGMCVVKKVTR